MLYIGRFLGGFAGGLCSVVSPTFIGEAVINRYNLITFLGLVGNDNNSLFVSQFFFYYLGEFSVPSLRGSLGFAFQLMVVTGILLISIFGLWVDWRLISAIMAVFPVVFVLCMIYIPESPYYLIKKGMLRKFQSLFFFCFVRRESGND